jgi:hypothetical protein
MMHTVLIRRNINLLEDPWQITSLDSPYINTKMVQRKYFLRHNCILSVSDKLFPHIHILQIQLLHEIVRL